jgi:Rhs element Vgr protein
MVDGERLAQDISGIELKQYINRHHTLKVGIREAGEVATRDISTYQGMLGKPISLTIEPEGGVVAAERALTFVGVITRIHQDNDIDAVNVTTLEARSPTISMDGNKRNAFFRDQSGTDIIGSIIGNYSITAGTVESGGSSMPFCVQYRETDWDFIMRLASSAGLFAHYDGQEFKATKPTSNNAEELVWRETLGSFSVGIGTAPQEFAAQVYNYTQSKSYTQDTKSVQSTASLSSLSAAAPSASAEIYPDSGFASSAKVVADARSLDNILIREKNRAVGRMITCKGQSSVPAIKVGQCIQVSGLSQLEGHYLLDSITHIVTQTRSYHNTFECRPLDIAFPAAHSAVPTTTQLQSARVVDNDDPESLGRIKVKFPWLESEETIWVRFLTPHAGADRGWYALPEIDDEVLVGYEFGSPGYPIALGALYNKDAAPASSTVTPENDVKIFSTKGGNQIQITDKSGEEEIALSTKNGDCKVVLNMSGPSITIESAGDISIKGANVTVESEQETTIKAGSNLNLEAGANLATKASGTYDAEGAMVNVKGNPINLN